MKPLAEEDAARRRVFVDGRYRPFGELTSEQVSAPPPSWGRPPAWAMEAVSARCPRPGSSSRWSSKAGRGEISDLDAATVATFAERLWILPPGGELLKGGPTGGR